MQAARDPRSGDDDAAEHLDALRRRLYRAGATQQDVRRYVAEQRQQPAASAPEEPQPARKSPARRPLRRAGAAVAIALAAAALVAVLAQRDRPSAVESRSVAGPSPSILQDVGEGDLLALDRGTASRPVAVAATVRGVAVVGQRFRGRGNAVVGIDPPSGAADGGRAQVTLIADGAGAVRWRALLRVARTDWSTRTVVMARGVAASASGSGTPAVFVYPAVPPTAVAVEAPDGVRWTLEVAATTGLDPLLR